MEPAVEVRNISHRYGDRAALRKVAFAANRGELFGIVGPNGSGKSTLFKILTTLIAPTEGTASILGADLRNDPAAVRRKIGVVFQGSIFDGTLSLRENMIHRGHFYGLRGRMLRRRIVALLDRLGLADREKDRVETLSGGLRRRGELAACLLHEPPVLLLDEPTTGLDPNARREFWDTLLEIRSERELTVLVTTHLMDEAEACDRLALLHQGEVVALASPEELKREMGHDIITIHTEHPEGMASAIRERFSLHLRADKDAVRIETAEGHRWIPRLVETFGEAIESITLSKPSIDDVFFLKTNGGGNGRNGEEETS